MTDKYSAPQERELLALRCQLARLKLAAARENRRRHHQQHGAGQTLLLRLADSVGNVAADPRLLKFALLPAKWRYRLLLIAAMAAWSYWSQERDRSR